MELRIPAYLTEKCKAAAAGLIPSGDIEQFAALQTDALAACDGKRELLTFAILQHNAYLRAIDAERSRLYCLATRPWYNPFRRC